MYLQLNAPEHIDVRACYAVVTTGVKHITSGDVEWCGAGFDGGRFTACLPGHVERGNRYSIECCV